MLRADQKLLSLVKVWIDIENPLQVKHVLPWARRSRPGGLPPVRLSLAHRLLPHTLLLAPDTAIGIRRYCQSDDS